MRWLFLECEVCCFLVFFDCGILLVEKGFVSFCGIEMVGNNRIELFVLENE